MQNQGTADESGIDVTVSSDDGSIDSTETISTIDAGATETVSIPLGATPKAGDSLTLNVSVTPVGCEEIEDNNEASYPDHLLTSGAGSAHRRRPGPRLLHALR